MAEKDTKKDIQKISTVNIFQDFLSRTIDQIEEGVGTVRFVMILLTILIVVPVVWLVITAGKNSSSGEINAETQEFKNKNEARYSNPRKIDDIVEIDSVAWRLLSVQDLGKEIAAQNPELKPCKAPDKKRFVFAKMTVENKKDTPFVLQNPPLYTGMTSSFGTYLNIPLCLEEQQPDGSVLFGNQTIEPGQSLTIAIYYAIPEDAKDLKLGIFDAEYKGVGMPKDMNYIGMGI